MFDKGEMGLLQKVNRSEKSICPNCFHYGLCMGEYNQPCFECNGFLNANSVTIQKWIPVSDPPKERECYFVTVKHWLDGKPVTREAYWNGADWLSCDKRHELTPRVTHWMPLPEPPKEES